MANIKRANTSGITKSGVAIPDVPDAPTIGAANNVGTSRAFNNGSATVAFTAAATGGTSTSFTATSTPGSFTATGAGSPLTVTGLQSATSYTFAVTGTNASATGAASASSSSITATTVPATPSAPTPTDVGTSRAFNNGAASVAFTAPATGGSAITGYTVTSSPGSYTGTGSSSPITVTGQQSATAYTYTITATNANGTSTASSASTSVTATTVPAAPTIGTATGGNASASVTFTAGATGGSSITGYTVTSSPGSITGTGASSPVTVSGLTNGTAYTFTVTATNPNGTSTASSASNSVTPVLPFWLASEADSGKMLGLYNLSADTNSNTYVSSLVYNPSFTTVGALGKIGSTGAHTWFKVTNQAQMYLNKTAVASSGNVYIAGTNNGTTPTRVLISKLNSSGAVQWARRLNTGSGNSLGLAIAIDSSENVYVGGWVPNAANTARTGFIAKYDTSGTIQWQRSLTNAFGTTQIHALTVDNNGDLIVGGTGGAGSSQSGLFLAKYNTSGTIQWQRSATHSAGQNHRFNALACDSSNNIYGAGYLGDQRASYAAEFNSSGTLQWEQAWNSNRAGDTQDRAEGIGVDLSGNVYYGGLTGYAGDGFGGSIVRGYMAKSNGSGTAQFTNLITVSTNGGGLTGFTFAPDQTMQGATLWNGVVNYILKAPSDGSKTGTYSAGGQTNLIYSSGMTRTNYGGTVTHAAGTQIDAAGILTDSAETLTFTDSVIPTAVTTI